MQCSLVSSAVWSFELLSNSRELDERHDWYSLPCALHQWGVRLSIHTGNKCSGSSPSCSMYNVFATYSTTYVHSCKNIIVFMPLFCSHIHLELLNLLQRWQIGESRSEGRKKKKKTDRQCSPARTSPSCCCWTATVVALILQGPQSTTSWALSLISYCSPPVISVCVSDANQLSAVMHSKRERKIGPCCWAYYILRSQLINLAWGS